MKSSTTCKPPASRWPSGPTIIKNFEDTSLRMSQFATSMNDTSRLFSQENGTFRRLMADPQLYNNVNDAVVNFNKSMARFDRVMQDLSVFSDKIARHPELLGVSGGGEPEQWD